MINETESGKIIGEEVENAGTYEEPEGAAESGINKETMKAVLYALAEGIGLVNVILMAKGMSPLPFDETVFVEIGSYVLGALAFVHAVWKNHNFTKAAQNAQEWLKAIKEDGIAD